jgi:hypothetical protein
MGGFFSRNLTTADGFFHGKLPLSHAQNSVSQVLTVCSTNGTEARAKGFHEKYFPRKNES